MADGMDRLSRLLPVGCAAAPLGKESLLPNVKACVQDCTTAFAMVLQEQVDQIGCRCVNYLDSLVDETLCSMRCDETSGSRLSCGATTPQGWVWTVYATEYTPESLPLNAVNGDDATPFRLARRNALTRSETVSITISTPTITFAAEPTMLQTQIVTTSTAMNCTVFWAGFGTTLLLLSLMMGFSLCIYHRSRQEDVAAICELANKETIPMRSQSGFPKVPVTPRTTDRTAENFDDGSDHIPSSRIGTMCLENVLSATVTVGSVSFVSTPSVDPCTVSSHKESMESARPSVSTRGPRAPSSIYMNVMANNTVLEWRMFEIEQAESNSANEMFQK